MKLVPIEIKRMGMQLSENELLAFIGAVAGECYNSDKTEDKCITRALNCIKRGHHSPFEHINITLNCTVDRGVSHALVRHRHCAFQQSSTIYQKFDEINYIDGHMLNDDKLWAYNQSEFAYRKLLKNKLPPSSARDVLPNGLATNLIITTNMRQWQYMFRRRNGPGDSDNMHVWAKLTREWFEEYYPRTTTAFDNWYKGHPL